MDIKRRNVSEGVQAWVEPVVIPTYPAGPPDPNPMFLERRVYQGSSGKVYPLPVIDSVGKEKGDRVYQAIHIENAYLYVMILPELGGRIHVAIDKTNDYDFIYRQNVIKPALVGLAGPWISGGIEINWPQHHRPSTFMPCSWHIEEHADGSVTVWLSEHGPMNRMKGMHGVCLRPGSACLELKGRIYNRTPMVQTFLWWANVAVHVNDDYQSFFPPDVHYVADHAKRATSTFPECTGFYYGVDYRPGTRLDWYKNIPVPTSYMVLHSDYDFFGGYDHGKRAGFVHVADRHIAPGKKQWTWGNHPFGHAWDRNLTDDDGPYVELMAGVFTDNQPDFSFLMPYETREFKQVWYPIQEIGPATNATEEGAISVRIEGSQAFVGVSTTYVIEGRVAVGFGNELVEDIVRIGPGCAWRGAYEVGAAESITARFYSTFWSKDGRLVVESTMSRSGAVPEASPHPATEPPSPAATETVEELYLTGLHLQQYRHATRRPETYWMEALRRDSLDSRCNTAMADWHVRRGEYADAEEYAQRAIKRLSARNPNPREGEAFYLLGLALELQGQVEGAIAAYKKATWNQAWASAAHYRLACVLLRSGPPPLATPARRDAPEEGVGGRPEARLRNALEHLFLADSRPAKHLLAALSRLGRRTAWASGAHVRPSSFDIGLRGLPPQEEAVVKLLGNDPLDLWALRELSGSAPSPECESLATRYGDAMRGDPQNYLDLAFDYASAGLTDEAVAVLDEIGDSSDPMIAYARAFLAGCAGVRLLLEGAESGPARAGEREPSPIPNTQYPIPLPLFPSRLEELAILEAADPRDARAAHLLGNMYYDRGRKEEAILAWERAGQNEPGFAIPWRNLGIAYFNVRHDPDKALDAYDKAVNANPDDARIAYERDQLLKRTGASNEERLEQIDPRLAMRRDDFTLELGSLYTQTGQPEKALEILSSRHFSPWEGGEGIALREWTRANLAVGKRSFDEGRYADALARFADADCAPENLGEARHLLANASDVWFWLGEVMSKLKQDEAARAWWTKAAEFKGDFQDMSARQFSEMTHFQAMALKRLGRGAEAEKLLGDLLAFARELGQSEAKIDYFATSLPTMLLFDDDLQKRQTDQARSLEKLARDGLAGLAAGQPG